MLDRALLFAAALCVGSLLAKIHIPIPFLLGGVLSAIGAKAIIHRPSLSWPKLWRDAGLTAAGYGTWRYRRNVIGRNEYGRGRFYHTYVSAGTYICNQFTNTTAFEMVVRERKSCLKKLS